jgi:colicin import membrane protein
MANPKNPVRAARQAKRQAVSAARTTRKVANIQAKSAAKVAKITAKTPGAQPKQASKSAPTTASKSTPKSGLTGKDLLTYGVKPKAPAAKGPSYAPFKTPADQKKSQQMTADAKRRKTQAATRQQEAAKKKAAADEAARKKKAAADAKRKKDAAIARKEAQDKAAAYDAQKASADAQKAAADEKARAERDFIQYDKGETRQNTTGWATPETIKNREYNDAKKAFGEKFPYMKDYLPADKDVKVRKRGGAVRKSMYNKRK